MTRPGRKGRILKWAGLATSLLIALLFAGSILFEVSYYPANRDWGLWLGGGWLLVNTWPRGEGDNSPFHNAVGWEYERRTIEYFSEWRIRKASGFAGQCLVIPLWPILLSICVLTATLWWLDRRRIPPGHCRRCGYNLTGNVSGVCPECGETT
jgi:hypothetical protein